MLPCRGVPQASRSIATTAQTKCSGPFREACFWPNLSSHFAPPQVERTVPPYRLVCRLKALPKALLSCSRLETVDLRSAVDRLKAQPAATATYLRQLLTANPHMR